MPILIPRDDRPTDLLSALLIVLLAFVATDARGQTMQEPGEIFFVFGSDTSTPGIDVNHRTALYHSSGFALFASPTRNGALVMDEAFRQSNTDWYGEPLKMTWWMQAGSLYGAAENTNLPLASTMSPYLMRTYRGEAIERLGDEFTFHYHTWVWSDYDGDGRYYWNQALSFEEAREDFDITMAQMLLEEQTFPVSFRSGWHYMDNPWQARLDELIPFSLHNDWPLQRTETEEPIDNVFDWSRAPGEFVPFHPSRDDYQRPGDGDSWNVRSISINRVREADIRQIFEAARGGSDRVACLWGHLADGPFVQDVQAAIDLIRQVATDYPEVPFRYTTAVEAMQRWIGTADTTPPQLTVEQIPVGSGVLIRMTTDEPTFQDVPFVAMKDRYERYFVLPVRSVGTLMWETVDAVDPAMVATVAVAITDTVGNLSKQTVRFLPDDIFIDDLNAAYAEVSGSWSSVSFQEVDHVWGTDIRTSVLTEGEESAARWQLPVTEEALYNVFVRLPEIDNPASRVDVELHVAGAVAATRRFEEAPEPNAWLFAGSAPLSPAADSFVELRASGDGQAGAVLAADAVRVTALVRDRQLELSRPQLDVDDVIAGDTATVRLGVRNLGVGTLTITGITSSTGVLTPAEPLPLVLDGPAGGELVMRAYSPDIQNVRDTLLIHSDDPIAPVRRLPFRVSFRDYFVIVDNDDAVGYQETGDWRTSVTQAYGESSRYAFVPSGAGAFATFSASAEQAGVYDAAYIIPRSTNSAVRADYIIHVDGVPGDSIRVDQNAGSGSWRSLGLYQLGTSADVDVTVRASDTDQPGSVLRADAFRLSRLGDELREIVLDDADPEHYHEVGPWQTSVAEAYGPSSRYAYPGNDQMAIFHTTAVVTGLHAIHEIVPTTVNATDQAQYRILRNGGLVESLVIDQNRGSGEWRPLGAWLFQSGDQIEVEVSDRSTSGSGYVLRADAIKLSYGVPAATAVDGAGPSVEYALGTNYPNPFRTRTQFTFTVPAAEAVTIELFDVLGRRVALLEDGFMPAGTYSAHFDASQLSSGLYVCRMRAGDYQAVRTWTVAR